MHKVYCDRDLRSKPLIPRKYEAAAGAAGSVVLFAFLILALSFLGGLS